MTKVCVLQSNYLPWPGYFQLILNSDLLIFLDDVQYTKNDWRNRNLIATKQGPLWLTVPVSGSSHQKIQEVLIDNTRNWQEKHLASVLHNYASSAHFDALQGFMDFSWRKNHWTHLSQLNQATIRFILRDLLHSQVPVTSSVGLGVGLQGKARLLSLLKEVGATVYLSGPAVLNYASGVDFEEIGIELRIIKYGNFIDNNNIAKTGQTNLSFIDLFAHVGLETSEILRERHSDLPWRDVQRQE